MRSKAQMSEKQSTTSTRYFNPSELPPESSEPSQALPEYQGIQYKGHNNYDTHQASLETYYHSDEPSMTVQAHAEDADINVLMRRYGITGKMPENVRIPTYGDFSEIRDFRSALEAVNAAHNAFMEIPADIRSQFNNDPQMFLEFTSNPANLDKMRAMGLTKPVPAPPPGPNPGGTSAPAGSQEAPGATPPGPPK